VTIVTFRSFNCLNVSHRRTSAARFEKLFLNLELTLKGAGARSGCSDDLLHGRRFIGFDYPAQRRLH
jgi:hypothetical protein